MSAKYSVGVDLGGTNLRAAVIREDGTLLEKISNSTPLGASPEPAIEEMVASIKTLQSRHGADQLAGVGVGVPGFIRMKEGVVAGWGNRPAFNGYPVRDEIEKRLGKKVFLENDANAAALGEKWMGAGRDVDDLVLLTLGTGSGGGIIIGGRDIAQWPPLHLWEQRLPGAARLCDRNFRYGFADVSRLASQLRRRVQPRRARQHSRLGRVSVHG
jgi:predicted NBD/HSP70 family sugar kinase